MNLQPAHLMVNYDLPWNPNRIEQRFGRIHRIGQDEICHLWNLVAEDTREGDVFKRALHETRRSRYMEGEQKFYEVKLVVPRGDAASLLFGFDAQDYRRQSARYAWRLTEKRKELPVSLHPMAQGLSL